MKRITLAALAGVLVAVGEKRPHGLAVGACLFSRVEPVTSENALGEHQADWLDIADPLGIGIDRRHDQLVSGQR